MEVHTVSTIGKEDNCNICGSGAIYSQALIGEGMVMCSDDKHNNYVFWFTIRVAGVCMKACDETTSHSAEELLELTGGCVMRYIYLTGPTICCCLCVVSLQGMHVLLVELHTYTYV